MSEREKLPNRRLNTAQRVEWGGQAWLLSVGWDRSGIVREIFVDGVKVDSDQQATLAAAAMFASRLLQSGQRASDLARWLGGGVNPVGKLLAEAAQLELRLGQGIREAYACFDRRMARA